MWVRDFVSAFLEINSATPRWFVCGEIHFDEVQATEINSSHSVFVAGLNVARR